MIKTIKKHFLIIILILIATFIRTYKITSFPPINSDEAALAYNAYSLLETGKDEHGISWPLHFKSFGDYKPGGYVYLALPFIKLLGLNTLAVRLPNLILSIISIYFFYKLVSLLSTKKLALYSTIVLSLSPWHIHFSRGAWESCTALSLTIIALYLFYSYILNLKSYFFLYLSVLFFSLSLYTYHSARLVTPLIILFLLFQNFSHLSNKKNLSKTIISVIFTILLVTPVFYSFLTSGGSSRFGGVGLTADLGPLNRANELLGLNPNLKDKLFYNKKVTYSLSWLDKYTSHFSPNFLFLQGDEVPRSKVPNTGQFYLFLLPIFIIGLVNFKKIPKKLRQLTLSLLFITPLASSLTFQAPSALRALSMVIPLSLIIAHGLHIFSNSFLSYQNRHCEELCDEAISVPYLLLTVLYFCSTAFYLNSYFVLYPKTYPLAWQYQFDKAIPILKHQQENFDHIYFTNKYDQAYILYLFYSQYDPHKLHPQIQLTPPDIYGFSTVLKIDNINFYLPDWDEIPGNSLIFASERIANHDPLLTLNFPNGHIAFTIYTK